MAFAAPVALGVMALGQVVGGIQQKSAYDSAARVDEENGRRSTLSGELEGAQLTRDERAMAGEMMVGQGENGGVALAGSNWGMIAESAYQRERDIASLRQRAAGEEANYRQSARDNRSKGRSALTGALFSAVSTAIGGAADIRAQRISSATAATRRTTQRAGYGTGIVADPKRDANLRTDLDRASNPGMGSPFRKKFIRQSSGEY